MFGISKKYFCWLLLLGHITIVAEWEDFFSTVLAPAHDEEFLIQAIQEECQDIDSIKSKSSSIQNSLQKKSWTVLVYMAADNDLRFFATNNIKQMIEDGSNENLNIVIMLSIRVSSNQKLTRIYYVEKNKLINITPTHFVPTMDSGDPQCLVASFKTIVPLFPAENYGIVFWNHGTGIRDPKIRRTFNPAFT